MERQLQEVNEEFADKNADLHRKHEELFEAKSHHRINEFKDNIPTKIISLQPPLMMPTLSIRKEILKQKEEEVDRLRSENTALSIEVGMLKKKLHETESSFRCDFLLFLKCVCGKIWIPVQRMETIWIR